MSDGDTFRAQATMIYRAVCVLLVIGPVLVGGLGWRFGRWWGLAVGGGLAAVLAVGLFVGVSLIWAMSQDGG